MSVNLPNEIRKFCSHSYRLKQILDNTEQCFQDINITGNFDGTPIITAELLKEEQEEIAQTVKQAPSFVVFGQTPYAKSRLINELFDKPLLPCPVDSAQGESHWRLVRFRQRDRDPASSYPPSSLSCCVAPGGDCDLRGESFDAENSSWDTIPLQELMVPPETVSRHRDKGSGRHSIACLEVILCHPLLRYCTQVVMSPSGPDRLTMEVVRQCVGYGPSVLLYGFANDCLGEKDAQDLDNISKVTNCQPIAFVRVPRPGSRTTDTDPPDGAPWSLSAVQQGHPDPSLNHATVLQEKSSLHSKRNGTDSDYCGGDKSHTSSTTHHPHHDATGWQNLYNSSKTTGDFRTHHSHHEGTDLQYNLYCNSSKTTGDLYQRLCGLGYLAGSEEEAQRRQRLSQDYFSLESVFIERFHEFPPFFSRFARQAFQRYLVNAATVMNHAHTRCLNMFILSAFDMARDVIITPKKLEYAQAKEEELYRSLMDVAVSRIGEIRTIVSRTILDLSETILEDAAQFDLAAHGIDVEQGKLPSREVSLCAEKIQDMVLAHINSHVANQLLSSFNILRDSYTGTLTRCLQSLQEQTDTPEDVKTTDALKQILNAAYQVEVTVHSSSSFICSFFERMKQMMMSMPWKSPPAVDSEWKRKVAADMLFSLSQVKLARCIAGQIKERLQHSHTAFSAALLRLQTRHQDRLETIEGQSLKLRKVHAPRLAKLALESTSLRDLILFGMPSMGREVGRGQYGVVYACDRWASYSPVAIKSVVPHDDKHWNDLALEFFYTKNIPEHPRVVMLRGSVIDYMYGGGMSPAVLLMMDRLQRDLHTAIMQNLPWFNRLQVSIDVVEGLRFLHSQGLIHRDVKMKNVLLDRHNRGKISDMGFCKPEAMISGSIVGTPIHMAPELVSGQYDNSVDVYAFGILFWYVCAGVVDMPQAFSHCLNKDELWSDVRKGVRPERLPVFTEECWQLMQSCWEGDPCRRPFFGDVQTVLCPMRDWAGRQVSSGAPASASRASSLQSSAASPARGQTRNGVVHI